MERACVSSGRGHQEPACEKLGSRLSNTRAERAVCSVFYPMHFIPKMADHQACAVLSQELPSFFKSSEERRPTGVLESRPIWASCKTKSMHP
jgi:hypothetical protein